MAVFSPVARSQGSFSIAAANNYVRNKDWNGLLRYSTEWTKAKPQEPMAWFYLGSTWGMGLRNSAQAVPAFQKAVALKSDWPEAWNALGHELIAMNRNDEAVDAFSHAVKEAPKNTNYWNNLAAAYSYSNRISKAVGALEDEQRVVGSSLTFVDWYNLGNGFLTMQEFKSATNAFREAIKKNPNFAPIWNNLGTLEGMLGNNNAALEDYQRASRLGDNLGTSNFARLQNAIAASNQSNSMDPLEQLRRSQNADMQYRAHQAWQERLARAQN